MVALCDQGSRSPGVFEGGCQTLTHASLGFPFHFSLLVASSWNLWECWHVWPDCLYGWWSYLAWQWSPCLDSSSVTAPLVYTMRSCGLLLSLFFKWGACSWTPWVWKSIVSRGLKNRPLGTAFKKKCPLRTTRKLSSQDDWKTILRGQLKTVHHPVSSRNCALDFIFQHIS